MRIIATIATKECLDGTRRFLRSLRNWDNHYPVVVYTTDEDLDLPGVNVVPVVPWWSGTARNAPAAIKPDIMLRAAAGLSVLYLDSSDIVFSGSLDPLFDLCERSGKMIAARPWREGPTYHGPESTTRAAFPEACAGGPGVNSGVIWFRAGLQARLFGAAWKALISSGGRDFTKKNNLVGDQQDFDVLFRTFLGDALQLGKEWNCRGHAVKALTVEDGRLYHDGDPVYIAHASGSGFFPPHTKEASRV